MLSTLGEASNSTQMGISAHVQTKVGGAAGAGCHAQEKKMAVSEPNMAQLFICQGTVNSSVPVAEEG